MKNKRVKLEDIAKALKISIATVSRALDNNSRVKESTRQKVLQLANELHYAPNLIAKSLNSGKTKIIGVIIPRYDEPFFIEVCRGIDKIARENQYRILISSSRNSQQYENENLLSLKHGIADGIILCPTHETKNYETIKGIVDEGMPLVLFDTINHRVNGADHVLIDDIEATRKAIKYLIDQGRKKIAFIGGTSIKKVFKDRYEGYRVALKDYKIEFNCDWVLHCDSISNEKDDHKISVFIENFKSNPDAIFATTDYLAFLTMKNLQKKGYKIPDDIAVIGFGNTGYGDITNPSLTCVDQPSFMMGVESAKLLITQLNEPENLKHKTKVEFLETKLIIREST